MHITLSWFLLYEDLERAASAFALLCMLSMVIGLVTGGYGLLGRQSRILVWASCCSLIAGNVKN